MSGKETDSKLLEEVVTSEPEALQYLGDFYSMCDKIRTKPTITQHDKIQKFFEQNPAALLFPWQWANEMMGQIQIVLHEYADCHHKFTRRMKHFWVLADYNKPSFIALINAIKDDVAVSNTEITTKKDGKSD